VLAVVVVARGADLVTTRVAADQERRDCDRQHRAERPGAIAPPGLQDR
jgi:hypothetical protein